MKPLTLEFCGINSFSEPAFIDFNTLLEYGIFGIFGDTGSGKSTILDCIAFALYGRIGRSSGKESSLADVVNFRKDRAYVYFEFETTYCGERHVFRIERTIRLRKGAKGGCEHGATLFERIDGALVTVEDGADKCGKKLLEIVGLNQDDFEKCIALPQGEFAEFVKSARSERLKIVARLFDLERFGEKLSIRARGYSSSAMSAATVARTRLEPYADVSEEQNAALQREIEELAAKDASLKGELAKAREEEKQLSIFADKGKERDALSRRFQELEEQKEGMKSLSSELERLGAAAQVVAAEQDRAVKEKDCRLAETALSDCLKKAEEAKNLLNALPDFDEQKAEKEHARLTEELARAARAEGDFKSVLRLERETSELVAALEGLKKKKLPVDFKKEIDELLQKREELGSEDLLGFLETHGRQALLRGEYAAFADELCSLEAKYPEIIPDTRPSIQRYRALSEGEKVEFSDLKRVFEERERARDAAEKALSELQKKKTEQEQLSLREEELRTKIDKLNEEVGQIRKTLADVPSMEQAKRALSVLEGARKDYLDKKKKAEDAISAANLSLAAATAHAENARRALSDANVRLSELLNKSFSTAEEAALLVAKYGDAEEAKERVQTYREEYASVKKRLRELSEVPTVSEERVKEISDTLNSLSSESEETTRRLAVVRENFEKGKNRLLEKQVLEKEYAEKQHEAEIAEKLKKMLSENRFIEFVAEEYLQTVAVNASARLLSLTGGRYFLRYDGSFYVGDNFNGGNFRNVSTLSGGEIFLVSLSLALSLSAEICKKSLRPIEFFFLDEGFGTLDGHLVDVVMDSLEKLKSEKFSIGLISHVEELKHRIGRKILVTKATETCSSKIKME